jgi:hypothetical protein
MEEQAYTKMEDAWKDPRIANAQVYKKKVIEAIDSYIGGLSETRRKLLPPDVIDTLDKLREVDAKTIPLTELQDIRSRILANGRQAFRSGDNFTGGENNAFARKIGDINVRFAVQNTQINSVIIRRNAVLLAGRLVAFEYLLFGWHLLTTLF